MSTRMFLMENNCICNCMHCYMGFEKILKTKDKENKNKIKV